MIEDYDHHNRKRLAYSKYSSALNPFVDRSTTRFPLIAMQRASAAAVILGLSDLLYRDVLEYLAGLKRAVAELHGFILWHREAEARESKSICRVFVYRMRGAIVHSVDQYELLSRLGIPAWLVATFQGDSGLLNSKAVVLADPPVWLDYWSAPGSTSSSSDLYRGQLVHNKNLDYYPPHVDSSVSFEHAARGYAPRINVFLDDKRTVKHVLDMVEVLGVLFGGLSM